MKFNANAACCYFCSEMISPIRDLDLSLIQSGSKTKEQQLECRKKRVNRFSVENRSEAAKSKKNTENMEKQQPSTSKLSKLGGPANELSQLNQGNESNGSSQSKEPTQNIFGVAAK